MNRRLPSARDTERFTFQFNGKPVEAVAGDTIASALLASGVDVFSRSIKYHRPRGPACLSGRCAGCLVRVDALQDVAACATPARPGMSVNPQNAYPSAKHDVLAAIDWMYPKGLDHHSMFTRGPLPLIGFAVAKVARHIAGLAPVPTTVSRAEAPNQREKCDVAIVGAGPAGLACAQGLKGRGLSVVVVEERPKVGGRLLDGLEGSPELDAAWAERVRADCESGGVKFLTRATVLAVYRDEGPATLAVRQLDPERLLLLEARQIAFCTGAFEPLMPFGNNDLPGIFAGRGLARMMKQQGVLPGSRTIVVGETTEALALARQMMAAGARVEAVVDPSGKLSANDLKVLSGYAPVEADGRRRVEGLTVRHPAKGEQKLECDLVALCGTPAPAIDLPMQAGAHAAFKRELGGYAIESEASGKTKEAGVLVAGDVTGATTAQKARLAGEALARTLAEAGRSTP